MGEVQPYMREAIRLAYQAKGKTAPNPPVGAVIVQGEQIIGRGFHPQAGEPHAEVFAIEDALSRAKDLSQSILFVTLEPCNHTGRTGPCVEVILKNKIRKVVIGSIDPNPLMRGKSIEALRSHGVEVISGVLQKECDELIRGFKSCILEKRPFITLKCAVSLDGKVATETGESKWITSELARTYAHELRAQSDAILVGINTVIADNPLLDARLVNPKKKLKKIVLDSRLRTPPSAKIFSSKGEVIIYCDKNFSTSRRVELENATATVVPVATKDGEIDLHLVLADLVARGVQELLVEGGAKVSGSFLKTGLYDEVKYFVAPKIIGEKGQPVFAGFNSTELKNSPFIKNMRVRNLGHDFVFEGTR